MGRLNFEGKIMFKFGLLVSLLALTQVKKLS